MEIAEDIRRVAESKSGQAFRVSNAARREKRVSAAREIFSAAEESEMARHAARMRAIREKYEAAKRAAREAHDDAEHAFFNKRLGG